MSFFEEDERTVTLKDPIPLIHSPDTLTVSQDLRYKSLQSIISSIQGYPMTVDYYSGVHHQHDDPRPYSASVSPVHAQYRLIKKMELKVESPNSYSHDSATRFSSVTGTANVYPVVIPNVGDAFIADIGDGRRGLFNVTSVESLSYFKDAVHRIQYELLFYLTNEIVADLDVKTVKRLHWRKDFLDYGQNPLVEDELIQWLRSLEEEYERLQKTFFSVYFSNEYRTFLVPGQSAPTYDPYLVKHMLSTYGSSKQHPYVAIKRLNTDDNIAYAAKTIFDVLAQRDIKLLDYCVHKVGLTQANYFSIDPMFHGLRYSGIQYVVYPDEPTINVDQQIYAAELAIVKSQFDETTLAFRGQTSNSIGTMEYEIVTDTVLDPVTQQPTHVKAFVALPLIHPVNYDNYYILSEAFYTKATTGLSLIEIQIYDYLQGERLNPNVLTRLCADWSNWGVLEKFYYTPLLMILLYVHIRQI